jgi:hypothetical protein
MDMKVKEDQIRELELKVQVIGHRRLLSYLISSLSLDSCSVLQCGESAL